MSFAAADAAFCQVTVLAPRGRVDLALPADVPVAELVPMVLELLGEPTYGVRPRPWRLSGVVGGPLPPGLGLRELGVLDGELLRIAPDGSGPPPPVFDDPVDALAATANATAALDRRFRRTAAMVLVGAAAMLLAGWPPVSIADALSAGWPSVSTTPALPTSRAGETAIGLAAVAGSAAVVALACAAWLARRPTEHPDAGAGRLSGDHEPWPGADRSVGDDRRSAVGASPDIEPLHADTEPAAAPGRITSVHRLDAVTAALASVPLAVVAGWAAWPAAPISARVLAAAAAAACVAAIGPAVVRVTVPALVGVVVAALPLGVGALVVTVWGVAPTVAAVGVGACAVAAGPLLPRVALWLSGMPRPVVASDAGELIGADEPAPDRFAERAVSARGYLAGLVGGCAIVAAVGSVPAAALPGWTGPAFAAVTIGLLGLRARSFADPGPARTTASAAVGAAIGLAVVLGCRAETIARPAAAIGLLIAAAVITVASGRTRTAGSPVRRRIVDVGEGLLTAAVVPLALGVTDLYSLVRGL